MTYIVTCRDSIVTDFSLGNLNATELAELVREYGKRGRALSSRAEFDEASVAIEFANRMARYFPEDEVGIWRRVQVAEAVECPGRRKNIDHFGFDA